ncbi:aspartate/glutamate racemase family protein [Microbacterium profundi]|uniref:Aspartate/glutamate racemase family protein n=1 Tax=Microbacterium profundi TaxID=450380 RepID=A0ABV3LHR9_9MICO
MKVRVITPIRVGAEELNRRQQRYTRLAPQGWDLALEDLPDDPGSPTELTSREQIAASEQVGLAVGSHTDAARYDALLPDCVLDPNLAALHDANEIPVLGITRLSAGFLASLGIRFGVVTRNEIIADEYRAVIERYGLGDSFQGAYVLGLSVEDVANTEIWNAAVMEAAQSAQQDGVTVLVNGCSAVEVVVEQFSVRVIDPTALALRVADFAAGEHFLP